MIGVYENMADSNGPVEVDRNMTDGDGAAALETNAVINDNDVNDGAVAHSNADIDIDACSNDGIDVLTAVTTSPSITNIR